MPTTAYRFFICFLRCDCFVSAFFGRILCGFLYTISQAQDKMESLKLGVRDLHYPVNFNNKISETLEPALCFFHHRVSKKYSTGSLKPIFDRPYISLDSAFESESASHSSVVHVFLQISP
jgi:hypothetical protein